VIVIALALGVSACIALPTAALVAIGWGIRSLWQGRRLDRSGGAR
jgi:hypothetical protein